MGAVLVLDPALRGLDSLTVRQDSGSVTFTALSVSTTETGPRVVVQAQVDGAADPLLLVFLHDDDGAWTTRSVAGHDAHVTTPDGVAGWLDTVIAAGTGGASK